MNDIVKMRKEVEEQLDVEARRTPAGAMDKWGFTGCSVDYITSIDTRSVFGASLAHKLLNQNHDGFEEYLGAQIAVEHWLVGPAQFTDRETGQLVHGPLLRLVLKDGSMLQTWGAAAIKSVLSYNEMVRPAPWDPPADFIIRAIGKAPNRYYQLEPVFEMKGK